MISATWRDVFFPGDASDFFARRTFPSFDPSAGHYQSGNALWLAELSRLTYSTISLNDVIPNHLVVRQSCFTSSATATLAILMEFDGDHPFAVLAFRGSAHCIEHVVTDLDVRKTPLGNSEARVHAGFLSALESVWGEIEAALLKLSCPVFLTGHSLGGALATLAATRYMPTAVYTFGSPRVGDAAFVAAYSQLAPRIHRVVAGEDIVTTVPPSLLGFEHIGKLRTLATAEHPHFPMSQLFNHPPKYLVDHAPISYVDYI